MTPRSVAQHRPQQRLHFIPRRPFPLIIILTNQTPMQYNTESVFPDFLREWRNWQTRET